MEARLIVLIIFVIYNTPVWALRYKWRSTVYRDKSFGINFKPYFVKDIVSLFSNKYFKNKDEIKMANFYRLYTLGLLILILLLAFL